jgi:RimJ/RimL family protein N-acetyltransferase
MLSHPLGDGAELRPLEPWRAAEFAASIERDREHLAPWLPWAATIVDADGARTWLQGYADKLAVDSGQVFGIWLDGVLVGGTVFRIFDADRGNCEIGVWIAPCAGGRGIVTRACRDMVDWAFRVRGMSRVEWAAVTSNERSLATAKRLGMVREGVLRAAVPADGGRQDLEIWAVVNERAPGAAPPPAGR